MIAPITVAVVAAGADGLGLAAMGAAMLLLGCLLVAFSSRRRRQAGLG